MAVHIAAAAAAALAIGVGPGSGSIPRHADTLRLAEVLHTLRVSSPALQAGWLRAEAAQERVAPAGAWMNPEVGIGLMNRPLSDFGTGEPMTMNTIRVSQTVPWPGRRGFRIGAARAAAEADSLMVLELVADLEARAAGMYWRLAATDRVLLVLDETRVLLTGLQETALGMYAVGRVPQQDVLQAQVSIARIDAEIERSRAGRTADAARLNALMGHEPDVDIGALEFPAVGPAVAGVDSLMEQARAGRPALAAAAARIRAAQEAQRAAERAAYPDLMLGVEYGQRPQYVDMISLMVGVRVPIFARSRETPQRREAEAERAGREADAIDLRNETWARLSEARAQAEQARTLSELYETRILPQARAAVTAALSAYRVGEADFSTVLDARMRVNAFAIEALNLIAEYHTAIAGIVALQGGEGRSR